MSLPNEKIEKLADKVSESVRKALVTEYKDLRKHEVSKEDARKAVVGGGVSGIDKFSSDYRTGKTEE